MKKIVIVCLLMGFFTVSFAQIPKEQIDSLDTECPIKIEFPSLQPFQQNSAGLLTVPTYYYNLNESTIKYLFVEILAYNSVNDIVSPELGRVVGQITGPIEHNKKKLSNNNFSTYYRGEITKVSVRIVSIEYLNGKIIHPKCSPVFYQYSQRNHSSFIIKFSIILTAISTILGLLLGNSL